MTTVASYLKQRLEELGLEQMFGVAGNYTAPFLDTILADPSSPIKIGGNANELCAGYAADAYARFKGIGAVYVTYSVGAFSLLNTIAGSYVEKVPVVLINGAPTNKEDAIEKNTGLLYSHTTGYQLVDIHMFRPVTAAAERITNAQQAPYQIDSALTAMLTKHQPVYLEISEDVWRECCHTPQGTLASGTGKQVTVSDADIAAQATLALIEKKSNVLLWAGIELQRFGLQDKFLALLEALNTHNQSDKPIKFVTSALSKSVVSESHPAFEGCVTLSQSTLKELVGDDGCLIGIGAWTTGKDTSNQDIRSEHTILAAHQGVIAGASYFPSVELDDYLDKMIELVEKRPAMRLKGLRLNASLKKYQSAPKSHIINESLTGEVNYDSLYRTLGQWINQDDILVVDAGFPLIGAQSVPIEARNGFVAQASWLSIGYSVGAGTGVGLANPDKRAIVVVGDGAFHETCQAVADQHAYGLNTVVFVIANGIYGIEQYLVNPNPFREPPKDYKDPLLDNVYQYNKLPNWQIAKLTDGFGGEGRKVENLGQLLAVMEEIRATPDKNFLVEVVVPETCVPAAIAKEANDAVGEDEIENPNWPPAGKF
ncbi:alpha-keto acid decarboxylase family protein [Thaumasiovibrio subtropicus]|uniref:alpha-keto acid decarboxylase family protein n=1 Tax=Thaumasiovibrio subtropicus TaxID=1891207 RepID=UPI00192CFB2B|nr:thiamine pyrophosphate-binding protein [Thaumasiovibrio subtropicus]